MFQFSELAEGAEERRAGNATEYWTKQYSVPDTDWSRSSGPDNYVVRPAFLLCISI